MKDKKIMGLLLAFAVIAPVSTPVTAGAYADSLAKCLVETTTATERTDLVKWMFLMMALHPEVSAMSTVTTVQRTSYNKNIASLFQKVVTKNCLMETKQALEYEGPHVIEQAFGQLGQVAARGLFGDPAVAKGMTEYVKYFDMPAMEEALGKSK